MFKYTLFKYGSHTNYVKHCWCEHYCASIENSKQKLIWLNEFLTTISPIQVFPKQLFLVTHLHSTIADLSYHDWTCRKKTGNCASKIICISLMHYKHNGKRKKISSLFFHTCKRFLCPMKQINRFLSNFMYAEGKSFRLHFTFFLIIRNTH